MAKRKHLELAKLFDETVLLYHRLSASAAVFYGRGVLSGPRRSLLVALARSGPQTVSRLARTRSQSRQRLQPLVNALLDEGLVQSTPNPNHKQSPLIVLTAEGEKAAARIAAVEAEARGRLRLSASMSDIALAAEVVREARVAIEEQWSALVTAHGGHRPRQRRRAR